MRIKIIGDNNCARATRHLLRLAGFAVTEFLPARCGGWADRWPATAITIDLAPAQSTPDSYLRPDSPTHQHASVNEEAARSHRDASFPSPPVRERGGVCWRAGLRLAVSGDDNGYGVEATIARSAAIASCVGIHFDSVDSALEAAVLRHVTQLAAAPVIVDRPGGVVHSDRELRIVAPNTGDAQADEAAAVAIEFGVLRGLLDLTAPGSVPRGGGAGDCSGRIGFRVRP